MISRCKKHRLFPRLRLRLGFNGCETCWRVLVRKPGYVPPARCDHLQWFVATDGRTYCRACGEDTTDMEAMGG